MVTAPSQGVARTTTSAWAASLLLPGTRGISELRQRDLELLHHRRGLLGFTGTEHHLDAGSRKAGRHGRTGRACTSEYSYTYHRTSLTCGDGLLRTPR